MIPLDKLDGLNLIFPTAKATTVPQRVPAQLRHHGQLNIEVAIRQLQWWPGVPSVSSKMRSTHATCAVKNNCVPTPKAYLKTIRTGQRVGIDTRSRLTFVVHWKPRRHSSDKALHKVEQSDHLETPRRKMRQSESGLVVLRTKCD